MKKGIVPLIIGLFVCIPLVAGAEPLNLSIEEALAIALRDNYDVLLKSRDVEKAKFKINESKAAMLPSLDISANLAKTNNYYSKDTSQVTTQFTLKEYLYRGGKTINTIKQNRDNFEVSRAILDKTKLELALDVHKAFYTLALADELGSLNKKIQDNIAEHLNFIRQRYNYGQSAESDILSLSASLEAARQAYETALNDKQSAEQLLKNLLNLDKDITLEVKTDIAVGPKELAFEEAFLRAMERRPEIKQYQAQLAADQRAVEIARAENRPSIYASWDYYSRSHLPATTTKNWNDYNIVGLTFSWPIFDGWATKNKVEQAIVDLKKTRLSRDKAIADIALELKNSYLSLKNALGNLGKIDSELVLYLDNLRVAEQRYKEGIVSALDYDDAGLKYKIAEFNKKLATYDYVIAKAAFDKATGGI